MLSTTALADNKVQLETAADGLILSIKKAEKNITSPLATLAQKAKEYKGTLPGLLDNCKSKYAEGPCTTAITAARKAQKAYESLLPMCGQKTVDDAMELLRETNKAAEQAYKDAMSSLDAQMSAKYKKLQSDKNAAIRKANEMNCYKPGVQSAECCNAISDAQTKIDDYAKGLRTFGKPPARPAPVLKPVPAPRKN